MPGNLSPSRRALLHSAGAAALLAPLGGCGFVLYPERRGRDDGRVDLVVVALDVLLLFVGVIPGLIAFIVDISSGCIYTTGYKSPEPTAHRFRRRRLPGRRIKDLDTVISEVTGSTEGLSDPELMIFDHTGLAQADVAILHELIMLPDDDARLRPAHTLTIETDEEGNIIHVA